MLNNMTSSYPTFSANPSLIQSHFGKKGNFEVVAGNASGGLVHIWRNDDDPSLACKGATLFAGGIGEVGGVSLIEGNFGSPGNLEVVVNGGGTLLHFFRETKDLKWTGPTTKVSPDLNAAGVPSFVQGTYGKQGNFELVSPVATGGLVHYSRNNYEGNLPWSLPTFFGKDLGSFTSVSLIQSNYGKHLEVAAVANGKLYFTWRDDGLKWTSILPIEQEYTVTGNPALIQSTFGGKKGNFELVVPAASGGLYHFSRDNNDGTKSSLWSTAVGFGQSAGVFTGVSLIQSNFGDGNLKVVAEKDGLLFQFVRVGDIWYGPNSIAPS